MTRAMQTILLALIFGGAVSAFAQESAPPPANTATPRVTARQMRQQRRIGQGIKSGEITPQEARRLEAREAKIQHDKKQAKSDGVVTPAERAKLNREENRASRAIRRAKHN